MLPHLIPVGFVGRLSHLLLHRGQLLLVELLQLHQDELVVGLVAEQDLHFLGLEGFEVGRVFCQLSARRCQVVDVPLALLHS